MNQLMGDFPHFLFVNHLTSKIGLPILFFVVYFSIKQRAFKYSDALHLVVPALFVINFIPIYFGSEAFKIALIQKMNVQGYDVAWNNGLFLNGKLADLLDQGILYFYTIAIGLLLVRHRESGNLPDSFVTFLKITFFFLLANLLPSLTTFFEIEVMDSWSFTNLVGLVSALFVLIGMFLIPDFLYAKRTFLSQENELEEIDYYLLRTVKSEELYQKVILYFESERPYLNPDFSLTMAEKSLGLTGRYISEAIKQNTGLNFSQFVSHYRIKYFTEILMCQSDLRKMTIDEISLEIGFNSVNNFYTHFKKVKGCTPREYLDENFDLTSPLLLVS
ncbi:AraC family transcriptional regulator [Algoriphagus sanaruensis]|uniref:AraC family transcriptional regulator n=1 Tax=Algoriphagus sanaruensis TaxID=1727163 RepID=UPI0011E01A81|nr:helix-turn-helix domain-containing protein [Algoriphagus sanaruensis]